MQKKISIMFLNRVYPPGRGATGRVLQDLAQTMAREGWHVTIITSGEKAETVQQSGLRIVRVKSSRKPKTAYGYTLIWIKMLFKALAQPRSDIVVSMTDPPLLSIAGHIIARRKKSHYIHWSQDVYPDLLPVMGYNFPPLVINFLRKKMRRALKSADRVIVIGRCMAKYLIHHGVDQSHMTVIPNWPDGQLEEQPEISSVQTDRAYDIDHKNVRPFDEQHKQDQKFRVLYAGTLGRAHEVDIILKAAAIVQESYPDIEFVFVGDGRGFEELATERSRRNIYNIRFLPFQPLNRLRAIMESGDVHLITMKDEALGLLVPSKIYSAFAAARPLIFVGPPESEAARTIQDFKAGIVIPPKDNPQVRAEILADAILKYRTDSDAWFTAHAGAAEAAKVFTMKDCAQAWIDRARALL